MLRKFNIELQFSGIRFFILIYQKLQFYVELALMGASRPQTSRCFLVLDYLFSSTKKLQFYVELALMGASRHQTPRCFLVLDYLFSSTRKLQFYVELA